MRYGMTVDEVGDEFHDDVVCGGGQWAIPVCPCGRGVVDVVVV